jgi:hypothetical protein
VTNEPPLRPDEDEYRTEQATTEVEPETPNPAAGSPPWVVIGVVLLVIFAALLAWAVLLPALG